MYKLKLANWQIRFLVGLFVCLAATAACSQRQVTDAAMVNNGNGNGDGDGEGLGGTGIDDGEGLGGTGIIGVVSDVDAFTVNGQHVEIDERTSVEIDGKIGSQTDLRRGQLVLIEAEGPPLSLRAKHIIIRHEIVGPVTRAAAADGHIFVLDQRVSVPRYLQEPSYPRRGRLGGGERISHIERRDPWHAHRAP